MFVAGRFRLWKCCFKGCVLSAIGRVCRFFVISMLALPAQFTGDVCRAEAGVGTAGFTWVPFLANTGQMDKEVAFHAVNRGGSTFVMRGGQMVHVIRAKDQTEAIVVREWLLSARNTVLEGIDPTETMVNWYRGTNPSMWREGLHTFGTVGLGSPYENIEASLVAHERGVEKLFIIQPGGNVSHIRIRIDGAVSLDRNESGEITVKTPRGQVLLTRPAAYQFKEGLKCEVAASYRVVGNEYGFKVGDFDHNLPLFIDPLLGSSFLGGQGNETAYAVQEYDGDVFIAGTAESAEFPGTWEGAGRLGDAFVVRLNRDLTTVLAATFIGGSLTEGARDMVVDASGVYIAGYNNSLDFPTTQGAAYAGSSVSGAFITRLDPKTLRMTASTAFYPNVFAIALGPGARVYAGGATGDPSFPLTSGSPYMAELQGGADAFVAGLSRDLRVVEVSTLMGGEGVDIIYNLTVDAGGDVLASGVTNSTAFPVSDGAYDPTYNLDWEETLPWRDGFVARFSAAPPDLVGSTYLGGGWNDSIQAMVLDGSDVIVGGNTSSVDFPCGNIFGPVDGNDAFVFRFDHTLRAVQSCAVFGGGQAGRGSPDTATDITVKTGERIFVTGRTDADDFPTTPGAFLEKPTGSYTGGFISSFTPDLAYLEASTLIHGGNEYLHSIALGTDRDIFVTGDAQNGSYPVTPYAVQTLNGGGDDLVVSRFSEDLTGPHIELAPAVLDFRRVPIGKSKTGKLTVYNIGGADLHIRELTFLPVSLSVFKINGSCQIIPAFDSCQLEVAYTPITAGPVEGTLLMFSNDLFNREKEMSLRGRGIAGPAIDVDRDRLYFGDVVPGRASDVMQVTVTNIGTGNLNINEVSLEGPDSASFILAAGRCTTVPLPMGGECRIPLQFAPVGHGKRSALLRIVSSDPAAPVYEVYLEGRGEVPPDIGEPMVEDMSRVNRSDRPAEENSGRGKTWLPGPVRVLGILFLLAILWLVLKYLGKFRSSGFIEKK